MTGQPALFTTPKPLTNRQQHALHQLQAAGHAGLTADQVGVEWHAAKGAHSADRRCDFCSSTGNELLRALRKRGLVKQRRDGSGTWVANGLPEQADSAYGEFPEGF